MLGSRMSDPTPDSQEPGAASGDGGVADAVRTAVERTMRATAGSASTTRERAGELVDEVVKRGRDARDELTRRGQEAGVELARRGQEATGEVGRRLEVLERRLAELEGRLGPDEAPSSDATEAQESQTKPQAEG